MHSFYIGRSQVHLTNIGLPTTLNRIIPFRSTVCVPTLYRCSQLYGCNHSSANVASVSAVQWICNLFPFQIDENILLWAPIWSLGSREQFWSEWNAVRKTLWGLKPSHQFTHIRRLDTENETVYFTLKWMHRSEIPQLGRTCTRLCWAKMNISTVSSCSLPLLRNSENLLVAVAGKISSSLFTARTHCNRRLARNVFYIMIFYLSWTWSLKTVFNERVFRIQKLNSNVDASWRVFADRFHNILWLTYRQCASIDL